jgi:hypothetical protein
MNKMDQDIVRQVSILSTPRFRRPREDAIVFAPGYPLSTNGLRERIRLRQIAITHDGSEVAVLERCAGTSCKVASSNPDVRLPTVVFAKAQIIQAYPNGGVRIWGEHEGIAGVWMLSPHGLREIVRMKALEKVLRSPLGNVAVGSDVDPAYQTYVLGDAIVVPRGTVLAFDERGTARGLIPFNAGRTCRWIVTPHPADAPRADEAGSALLPLPFRAETVAKAYFFQGRLECLLRDGDVDAVWRDGPARRTEDQLTRMTKEGSHGGMEDVWTSSDTHSIAHLLRVSNAAGGTSQRLLVNGRSRYEGSFFASEFQWSPDGTKFVAHLSLVDSDGNQQKQLLVSDGRRREIIRAGASAFEPRIDDEGRIAYVVADSRHRRLVADTVATEGYPFVWNVSQIPDAAVANVLADGQRRRIELPYDR